MPRETKENAYAYSYHVNYIRNARAIGIAWGIFTLCFAILVLLILLEPYWLQTQTDSLGSFGLIYFERSSSSLLSVPERDGLVAGLTYASWFVIAASAAVVASIIVTVLFLCKTPSTPTVFKLAGVLQLIAGICLFFGVVLYPSTFETDPIIPDVCPGIANYSPGDNCFYSWTFYLAIVGILDALALGILALVLARKQEKVEAEVTYSDYSKPNGKSPYGYGTGNSLAGGSIGRASSLQNGGSVGPRSVHSEPDRGEDAAKGITNDDYARVTPRSERKAQNGQASARSSQRSAARSAGGSRHHDEYL